MRKDFLDETVMPFGILAGVPKVTCNHPIHSCDTELGESKLLNTQSLIPYVATRCSILQEPM